MKADRIFKNAKIFTSDKNNPMATALVVKDGKFKTMWNTIALVTWSSDEVFYVDFKNWSPYLAMETA